MEEYPETWNTGSNIYRYTQVLLHPGLLFCVDGQLPAAILDLHIQQPLPVIWVNLGHFVPLEPRPHSLTYQA